MSGLYTAALFDGRADRALFECVEHSRADAQPAVGAIDPHPHDLADARTQRPQRRASRRLAVEAGEQERPRGCDQLLALSGQRPPRVEPLLEALAAVPRSSGPSTILRRQTRGPRERCGPLRSRAAGGPQPAPGSTAHVVRRRVAPTPTPQARRRCDRARADRTGRSGETKSCSPHVARVGRPLNQALLLQ